MEEEVQPGAAGGEPYSLLQISPSLEGLESEEDEEAIMDFDLEALPELGLQVDCFLQGLAESSGEEDGRMSSPEPPVEELGDLENLDA